MGPKPKYVADVVYDSGVRAQFPLFDDTEQERFRGAVRSAMLYENEFGSIHCAGVLVVNYMTAQEKSNIVQAALVDPMMGQSSKR
jgi:hypothetical protein